MTVPALRSLLVDIARDFRRSWRQLAVAHLLSSIIATAVLTPLGTGLLRLWVGFSGNRALTDLDILYFFFLNPYLWSFCIPFFHGQGVISRIIFVIILSSFDILLIYPSRPEELAAQVFCHIDIEGTAAINIDGNKIRYR